MFDAKKENILMSDLNVSDQVELITDNNINVHTMQDDVNALSGIFPKKDPMTLEDSKTDKAGKEEKTRKNETKEEKYFNPFLDGQLSKEGEKIVDFAPKNEDVSGNMPTLEKKIDLNPNQKAKSENGKKIIWVAVIFVIVGAFFSGGYYFIKTRNNIEPVANENVSEIIPEEIPKQEEQQQVPVIVESQFSQEKPNYFSLEVTKLSFETFKEAVYRKATEIKEDGISKPIEFILTDENNNPIDFSEFALLTGINLSENIKKNLEEQFSLYIHSDSNEIRVGFSLKIKDKAKIVLAMKNEESKLISNLAPLYLDGSKNPKNKVVFSDNNYNGVAIRYFNFDDIKKNTLDYAFMDNFLVLTTSKNSMWALVDKIISGGK